MYIRKRKKEPPICPFCSVLSRSVLLLVFICPACSVLSQSVHLLVLICPLLALLRQNVSLEAFLSVFMTLYNCPVSEFDASHTFYFLVDQFVKVRVYRVLALVNHCYKIFDESNSELTFEVGTYGVTWVEQVAFASPLSNGHRFRESKGGAQPSGFMSVVSAIDWISVSPELLQPSYSYGPQVRTIVLLCSLLAGGYGKDVFFEVGHKVYPLWPKASPLSLNALTVNWQSFGVSLIMLI
ncbi:hypothetical protein Cgig2_000787 [Carnegiea gigantea]|uniref:Uncharacterized protein n=1 Tax=Carnegiea gigantea TaxID=171969 RepID=A0A9Q1QMB1_9CARY|nr:hypothetical protein Cgig2_000787 [Carnegiea gigantea]